MKQNGDSALNKSLYNSFYVWARFSFYLLFFSLIICCRQEQIPSDHPGTYLISEVSVYQNPKSLTGESVYLSDETIIGPIFRIRQLQDNIFFGMQLNQNQYLAALIDVREEKVLREIIPPGNAPLELISIFDYFVRQDSFYVIDYLSRRMIATSIDSLVRSPKELTPENSRQYAVNTSFPIVGNITRVGDEIITKNYDYNHPDSAFARLDPYTLEVINYFGKHPFRMEAVIEIAGCVLRKISATSWLVRRGIGMSVCTNFPIFWRYMVPTIKRFDRSMVRILTRRSSVKALSGNLSRDPFGIAPGMGIVLSSQKRTDFM